MKSTFETFKNLSGNMIKTGLLALLIGAASCSKDDNNEEPVKPDPKIELTINPTLGNYLTTAMATRCITSQTMWPEQTPAQAAAPPTGLSFLKTV